MSVQAPLLRLVVFVLDGQRYALALEAVERVLPMVAVSPLPKAPAVALGVIDVHGQVVPVVDVRGRFGLPPRDHGVTGHLVLARTQRRRLALPVDEAQGVLELASTTVTRSAAVLPGIGHVAGIATLPDGLVFIHDVDAFLALDEEQELDGALEGMAR